MPSTFVASPDVCASSSGTAEIPSANAGRAISGLAIFLGAFLLFQIQPIIAKMILPWFGGSAVVWTACMLFFQTELLLGYAYAHWLSSQTRRGAHWLHIGLLAASLVLLPIIPSPWWKPAGDENPLPRILGLLAVTVGAPYFLLSSTSPLVQTWYARRSGGAAPYRFFALSNLASLLALLSYPVLVEPWVPARVQGLLWSAEYAVFALVLAWLAYGSAAHRSAAHISPATTAQDDHSGGPSWGQRAVWIILPACASFLLLATTNHLCQNVAVVPFLWIVPLSLYLLSFILCFDREHWYHRKFMLPLYAAALASAGYLLLHEVPGSSVFLHITAYAATFFIICMFCHGELALRKPGSAHLTQFYLMVSLGGALGSALVGVAAPLVLRGVYEFPMGLAACGMLTLMLEYRKSWRTDAIWATLAVWLLVVTGAQMSASAVGTRLMARSFYGALRVTDSIDPAAGEPQRTLVHGVVAHGVQLLSPALRHEPTSYYARSSGVGIALRGLGDQSVKVGVIGLGAGTMAAYGRRGDEYRFYELDPLVIRTAQSEFSFLQDSGAKIELIAGDGRLALEREHDRQFDLLAVDAFSGDSIPVHLLSREAFELYFDRLAPSGVLAVHVSNSFLDLAPVVGRAAQTLGKFARVVEVQEDAREHRGHSLWVLLASHPKTLDRLLPPGTWRPAPAPAWLRVWTDDYSNLFQILK